MVNQGFVSNVKAAGAKEGIDFTLACRRTPNTLLAHTLLGWAGEMSAAKQNEVAEVVFRKYHTDGFYPDEKTLVSAAAEAGLDEDAARAAIKSEARRDAVQQEVQNNAATSGVPYFVINGKGAFSGARPSSAFLQAFDRA